MSASAQKLVATTVGVFLGKKNKRRACQSKLYPQHEPLYPFERSAIRSSAN